MIAKTNEGGHILILENPGGVFRMEYRGTYATWTGEKSDSQLRIENMMNLYGQTVPAGPVLPDEDVRRLRAKLILEEALETIAALGFDIEIDESGFDIENVNFVGNFKQNLVSIIDGCIDTRVVVTGTLSACGVPDNPYQWIVDMNNLEKLKGGHRRADGKWVKPVGFVGPTDSIIKRLNRPE